MLRWLVDLQIIRKNRGRYYLHPVDAEFSLAQIPETLLLPSGEADPHGMTRKALRGRVAEYFCEIRKPMQEWASIQDLEPQLAEFDLRCRAEQYDAAALLLLAIGFKYLRSRFLHLLRMIAAHDATRQVSRLALLIEGDVNNLPPDPSVLDHEAVRTLRAAMIPVRLTRLHTAGASRRSAPRGGGSRSPRVSGAYFAGSFGGSFFSSFFRYGTPSVSHAGAFAPFR